MSLILFSSNQDAELGMMTGKGGSDLGSVATKIGPIAHLKKNSGQTNEKKWLNKHNE